MIPRVERLPRPEPDINNLLAVLRRQKPRRVPMLELKIDEEVMSALLGEPYITWSKNAPADARSKSIEQTISLAQRLGFDAFRLRTAVPLDFQKDNVQDTANLSRGQRQWQNEHHGPIQTTEDLERYPWPELDDVDFGPVDEMLEALPEGMACIAYCSGVFEWSSWLMGLERFSTALYDAPELVRAVVDRVGGSTLGSVMVGTGGMPVLLGGGLLSSGFTGSSSLQLSISASNPHAAPASRTRHILPAGG